MAFFDNDRWRGVVRPELNARYLYTIIAWRDLFESWRDELSKKHAAGVEIGVELVEGRTLVEAAVRQRPGERRRPEGAEGAREGFRRDGRSIWRGSRR